MLSAVFYTVVYRYGYCSVMCGCFFYAVKYLNAARLIGDNFACLCFFAHSSVVFICMGANSTHAAWLHFIFNKPFRVRLERLTPQYCCIVLAWSACHRWRLSHSRQVWPTCGALGGAPHLLSYSSYMAAGSNNVGVSFVCIGFSISLLVLEIIYPHRIKLLAIIRAYILQPCNCNVQLRTSVTTYCHIIHYALTMATLVFVVWVKCKKVGHS